MENQTVEVVENVVASAPKNEMWGWILYCLVVMAVIYFFIMRPNKRSMDEYKKMLDSLKVGNRVMAAGIYGTIKKVNEKTLEVEIAKGVVIEVNKNAVASAE